MDLPSIVSFGVLLLCGKQGDYSDRLMCSVIPCQLFDSYNCYGYKILFQVPMQTHNISLSIENAVSDLCGFIKRDGIPTPPLPPKNKFSAFPLILKMLVLLVATMQPKGTNFVLLWCIQSRGSILVGERYLYSISAPAIY